MVLLTNPLAVINALVLPKVLEIFNSPKMLEIMEGENIFITKWLRFELMSTIKITRL